MYRFHRSKGWLSLWLIVAVLGHFGLSHTEASAWVLCFGVDSHVAVEPADHNHFVPPTSNGISLAKGDVYTEGLTTGESPCLDIPVVSEDHGAHKPLSGFQQPSLDEGLAAVVLIIAVILFPHTITKPAFLPDPSIVDSRLVALRSVVLLN
ncbi:hypothetical protein Noc_1338 [Nitrosococcus oceani ATCC 19707]|uniref:Uncharacterized protein n=2 Tax=Nitrosococcus oceani TaxID=1229 RepID=Q3JBG3_NITOC|nr:hypothetical protein [Nitrosococcus oceani]ABA57833.1 hypothetical protein Noc_1338 [Nitrosococcus oceani ATCC 19707]EDZ67868.1 hypothetical protein NOC27_1195 [Nitrosococcus oceani AFC27]KFI19713.1 hypothetical protein IB75_06980 [Nitrosococcus oceani C-27]GEM19470.1 hypothetical protein NONS58_08570 [Nitrosococcus oceani]